MRKATRTQWIKFSIVTLLYLAFLVWVKSWLGLIVLPFIFDIYISIFGTGGSERNRRILPYAAS